MFKNIQCHNVHVVLDDILVVQVDVATVNVPCVHDSVHSVRMVLLFRDTILLRTK